ncbi:cupin [Salinisphaera aquimarina]|uniref:Cupin n=1 Tax=Salinisphaera aquimarina TaxID=2094031 RepID=A0ABV7EPD8_9GAMM
MALKPIEQLFGARRPVAERLYFDDDGRTPNSRYPVLVYRGEPSGQGSLAEPLEALFAANAWPPQWRGGVFDFHHYHSVSHETLGVARGHAVLMLGGEDGSRLRVTRADVLVLPAGTGHCRMQASTDFELVGAYQPDQQRWDICRSDSAADHDAAIARIARASTPDHDPVNGRNAGVPVLWR